MKIVLLVAKMVAAVVIGDTLGKTITGAVYQYPPQLVETITCPTKADAVTFIVNQEPTCSITKIPKHLYWEQDLMWYLVGGQWFALAQVTYVQNGDYVTTYAVWHIPAPGKHA